MFTINSGNEAWASYYTGNPWFYHVSGGLLLYLFGKIANVLMYFELHRSALRKRICSVLTTLGVTTCMDVD